MGGPINISNNDHKSSDALVRLAIFI